MSVISLKFSCSFNESINQLVHYKEFREEIINALQDAPFKSYRMFIPKRNPFQIILKESKYSAHPDPTPFEEHLNSSSEKVVVFPNVSGSAILIVPQEITNKKAYGHIGAFIENAPIHQIHELLKKTGKVIQENPDMPWISTSGYGVNWLHIRVDSQPKYLDWAVNY